MAEETKTQEPLIFGLRTTANREDQVMDFVTSNAEKKKHKVYSIIRPHGMRGYIFLEAETKQDAEQAAFNIPYARGILPKTIEYKEIEHMLEMVKVEMNIRKNDIVEIISGPFKREQAKVTRIDKVKEEVVVELLEAAVPIPITVKMDAVKVIRRESEEEEAPEEENIPLTIPSPEAKARPEFIKPGETFAEKVEEAKEKAEEVIEEVKEAVEKVEEVLHIKKKREKKEKPKPSEDELFSGEDIESIADIGDEELKEELKTKKEEKAKAEKEKQEKSE